jgi:polyisoprenoid-binding protein YceI
MYRLKLLCLLGVLIGTPAHAEWTLNNDKSSLSFVSIKASDIAEVHHFKKLTGVIEDDGSVNVEVELASVDTLIPIRDERMRDVLFEINVFPVATITAKIDPALNASLKPGEMTLVTAEVLMELHGEAAPTVVELQVVRLTEDRLLVTSARPVVVNVGMFNLVDGVEQLREIAGLPNISKAVPITFTLLFENGGT